MARRGRACGRCRRIAIAGLFFRNARSHRSALALGRELASTTGLGATQGAGQATGCALVLSPQRCPAVQPQNRGRGFDSSSVEQRCQARPHFVVARLAVVATQIGAQRTRRQSPVAANRWPFRNGRYLGDQPNGGERGVGRCFLGEKRPPMGADGAPSPNGEPRLTSTSARQLVVWCECTRHGCVGYAGQGGALRRDHAAPLFAACHG